jgi:hypothetical protein
MKHGERTLVCTLAAFAMCTAANAITGTGDASGSPYQSVVERNVFGLKPPPPPPDPEANKPPPPKMFLQGITTFGGTKRALLKTQMPAKPGEPPKGEQSFVLAEGQREGDIEVLEIDAKGGTVKVNDFGTIATLDFEHNGIKTVAAAPVAGAAPHPAGGLPAPGANPFTPAGGAQPPPITRPLRLPRQTGASASFESGGATPAYASGTTAYGGGTPSLGLGGTQVPLYGSTPVQTQPQPQAAASPTSQLTAEEQFLIVEANREQNQRLGLKVPPIPPTPLTPDNSPTTAPTTTQPNVPPLPRPGQPLLPRPY